VLPFTIPRSTMHRRRREGLGGPGRSRHLYPTAQGANCLAVLLKKPRQKAGAQYAGGQYAAPFFPPLSEPMLAAGLVGLPPAPSAPSADPSQTPPVCWRICGFGITDGDED
jgi:hypothetical protein